MTFLLRDGEESQLDEQDAALAETMWYLHATGYAMRKHKYLHRLILERKVGRRLTSSDITDHINRNKLDNRRENLRCVTRQQNLLNVPARKNRRYKGVYFFGRGRSKPWIADIQFGGTSTRIGYFKTAEEAAYIYDQWALQLFGDFAYTNLL